MGKDETGHTTAARPINRKSASADGSKKIQAKIKSAKLNHLRNDLDLYHHRVRAWLDNKELPSDEEIKGFGKGIIQRLQDRQILKKEEIRNINLSEKKLTPRRSCSASPDRTPQSDRKSRHETHYAKTKEVNDLVRKRIDFDDEEEHLDIKVKDLKDAKISFKREIQHKEEIIEKLRQQIIQLKGLMKHQCSILENEQEKVKPHLDIKVKDLKDAKISFKREIQHKEEIIEKLRQQITQLKGLMKHQCSILENEQEKVKPKYLQEENSILKMTACRLENENAYLKSCLPTELRKLEDQVKHYQLQLSSLREENTSMKTDLEKMVQKVNRYRAERNDLQEQKKQSSCFHCTSNDIHVERYKAERDAAVQERNTLIRALQRYKDRESELTLPNSCFHQDMEYLKQKLNNAEADIKHYKMENDALHNTIENQKKMILEMENRKDENTKKNEDKFKLSDERINDANKAIAIYQESEERYKQEKEEDSAKIIHLKDERDRINAHCKDLEDRYKNSKTKIVKLQSEKEETLSLVQKHKTEISRLVQITESLQQELEEEKRNTLDLKETVTESEKKMKTLEKKIMLKKEREIIDFKCKEEKNKHLKEEIESLKNHIGEMETKHAKEQQEHFAIEQKYKQQLIKLREEKDIAHRKVKDLKTQINDVEARLKEQQTLFAVEKDLLENRVKDLKKELSKTDSQKLVDTKYKEIDYQKKQLDEKNEEIVILSRKLYSLEEERNICKEENILMNETIEDLRKKVGDVTRQLNETESRYSSLSNKRLSDIEKENTSLSTKLTESLHSLVKLREEHRILESRSENDKRKYEYEFEDLKKEKELLLIENQNFIGKIEKMQDEITQLRSKRVLQEQATQEEEKHRQQYLITFENSRETMKMKIDSLESDNSALKERLKDLERDLQSQQRQRSENESLNAAIHAMKIDFENLEKRYKNEAEVRRSTDNMSSKYKEENERLRKERSLARNEVHRLTRETSELGNQLKTEIDSSKSEIDKLKREKEELSSIFKEESQKDHEKINKLERECDMMRKRYSSDEKANQHNAYELMQLKNDYEVCKQQKELLEIRQADAEQEKSKLSLKIRQMENHQCPQCVEYSCKVNELKKEIQEFKYRETLSLSRRCQQCDENEKKMAVLQETIEKENKRYAAVSDQLHKAEKKTHEMYERNDDTVRKKDVLQKEKIDLQNRIKSLEKSALKSCEKCRTFENSIGDLQRQLIDLEQKYNKIQNEYQKEINAKQELQIKTERQNDTILNTASKMDSVTKEKQSIEKKLRALEQSSLKPCEKCQTLERNVTELQTHITDLQQKFSRLNRDYQKEEKINQDLQERILDASSRIEKLSKEKEDIEIEFRELKKSRDTGHEVSERKVNILELENKDLKNKCSQRDELLNKADKEIRQLKGQNHQLDSDILSCKQEKDTIITRLEILREEKTELEDRLRRRSPQVVTDPKNCQNCWKYRNEISDLKREVNGLRDRLSEAAGNKLRDNNPNIADLSDMNRPTSLAEKFSSLYTDEYTDAMEVIEESMDEAGCVRVMLTWLKICYDWCERLGREQKDLLTKESIGFMSKYHGQKVDFVISDRCLIYVKEYQKKIAADSLEAVGKICHVNSVKQENLVNNNYIIKYIKKCSELCWMMQISDPPLYLNFDVNVGEKLDKNMYNVFTHSGSKIEYLVWPILYLHKTGPMLAKGVAQGM